MTIDPLLATIVIVALVLGILIGVAIRAPLKRKAAVLAERVAGLERERDGLIAERERLGLEIKAREAQIRPLSDEVDKLRRDFAKLRNSDTSAGFESERDRLVVDRDRLGQLKGVGPKFVAKLHASGITRIDQIAGWSGADIEVIDSQMGDFRGRIAGDRLVEQAKLLTEGRYTEYETLFGKLA